MYKVKSVQVLLENEEGAQIVKTYDPAECCAVFWGKKGREFYRNAITDDSTFTLDEQDRRLSMLHEIESAVTEEELVFGKTTECTPR